MFLINHQTKEKPYDNLEDARKIQKNYHPFMIQTHQKLWIEENFPNAIDRTHKKN